MSALRHLRVKREAGCGSMPCSRAISGQVFLPKPVAEQTSPVVSRRGKFSNCFQVMAMGQVIFRVIPMEVFSIPISSGRSGTKTGRVGVLWIPR